MYISFGESAIGGPATIVPRDLRPATLRHHLSMVLPLAIVYTYTDMLFHIPQGIPSFSSQFMTEFRKNIFSLLSTR